MLHTYTTSYAKACQLLIMYEAILIYMPIYIYIYTLCFLNLLNMMYINCVNWQGCDASILIDPVNGDNSTEKNAAPSRSIQGYEVIDEIKTKLEEVCPQTVSCADITAIAARDAVSFQVCYYT